jgi:guanine deaminase
VLDLLLKGDVPGAPFSGLLVRNGQVIGKGVNSVRCDRDPTAHAEVQVIRDAAFHVGPNLAGATLYASAEPRPMFLAAAVYAGVRRIVFALSAEEAATLGYNYGMSRKVMDALRTDFPDLSVEHVEHANAVVPLSPKGLGEL